MPKKKIKINYVTSSPEKLKIKKKFDVILSMEIIEHVSDLDYFIKSCSNLLKKNGVMFVATINRTLKSYLFASCWSRIYSKMVTNWNTRLEFICKTR